MRLFEHQKEAVQKMKNGCILCGGVGTGKSMTALAYYVTRICDGSYTKSDVYTKPSRSSIVPLYIITTAKKRDSEDWVRELKRFGLDTLIGTDIFIDSWNNIKKYSKVYAAFFIFDEQKVSGYGAWVKTFINITRKNRWILLSATPGDVWTDYIPVFIANGFYKNKSDFYFNHVRLDPRVKNYPKIIGFLHEDILEKHRREVLVLMKYDKPCISHHEEVIVDYDMDDYHKIWKERWNIFKDKPIENVSQLYAAMRRSINTHQSRIDAIQDICARTMRVIIFYNFTYELYPLRAMCMENGFNYAEWNGIRHDEIPDTDTWVYLVQFNSAEGWECIDTNTMIFYSQPYSYKALTQAAGRISRLTTPFTDLYFYHVRSKAPLDIRISKALNRKEDFNESADYEEESDLEKDYLSNEGQASNASAG